MYIRRIDDYEIQCMLDKDDLEKYGVTLDEIMTGNPRARRLIEDIISRAENEYGFRAGALPLSVEIRPVNPDGMAMVISSSRPEESDGKQELIAGLESLFKTLSQTVRDLKDAVGPVKQIGTQEKEKTIPLDKKPALIRFSDYDNMYHFIKRSKKLMESGEPKGDIYYMDKAFYLWIIPESMDKIWKCTVSDYGEELLAKEQKKEVLEEHGKRIGSIQKLLESIK